MTGGVDAGSGGTMASAQYVRVTANDVLPLPEMSEPRDSLAAVTLPRDSLSAGSPPQDRVYVFGGVDRRSLFRLVMNDHVAEAETASRTAESYSDD